MSVLNRICNELSRRKIRYAVVGGYAVALHGAVRGTVDIDVVVNWDLTSLQALEGALTDLGLVSRLPITARDVFGFRDEYIRNRNLVAWNFYNPDKLAEQVDVIINYDLRGQPVKKVKTNNGTVPILGLQALINMKKSSGRDQDLADVTALEKLL